MPLGSDTVRRVAARSLTLSPDSRGARGAAVPGGRGSPQAPQLPQARRRGWRGTLQWARCGTDQLAKQ